MARGRKHKGVKIVGAHMKKGRKHRGGKKGRRKGGRRKR